MYNADYTIDMLIFLKTELLKKSYDIVFNAKKLYNELC